MFASFYGNLTVCIIQAADADSDGTFQRFLHIFAPLHSADTATLQIIFPTDIEQIIGRFQPVHIEMEQGHSPLQIFIDDGISWAGHRLMDAKSPCKATGKGCLSRPKITVIGNDITGTQSACQLFAQSLCFLRPMGQILHHIPLFKIFSYFITQWTFLQSIFVFTSP